MNRKMFLILLTSLAVSGLYYTLNYHYNSYLLKSFNKKLKENNSSNLIQLLPNNNNIIQSNSVKHNYCKIYNLDNEIQCIGEKQSLQLKYISLNYDINIAKVKLKDSKIYGYEKIVLTNISTDNNLEIKGNIRISDGMYYFNNKPIDIQYNENNVTFYYKDKKLIEIKNITTAVELQTYIYNLNKDKIKIYYDIMSQIK
jgi:hypothetical protein